MEHKTQGSELYVLDTTVSPPVVLKIAQVMSIDGLGGQASKIDVTTFDDRRFRRNLSGLIDPGAGNLGLIFDQSAASQQFLHENAGGDNFQWAIGISNGYGIEPNVNGSEDGFDLPTSRGWITFEGSINQDSLALAIDDVIKLTSALQLSGEYTSTPKVA